MIGYEESGGISEISTKTRRADILNSWDRGYVPRENESLQSLIKAFLGTNVVTEDKCKMLVL